MQDHFKVPQLPKKIKYYDLNGSMPIRNFITNCKYPRDPCCASGLAESRSSVNRFEASSVFTWWYWRLHKHLGSSHPWSSAGKHPLFYKKKSVLCLSTECPASSPPVCVKTHTYLTQLVKVCVDPMRSGYGADQPSFDEGAPLVDQDSLSPNIILIKIQKW